MLLGSQTNVNLFFKWIRFFIDHINLLCVYLSGICLFLISMIVSFEVIARFIFRSPTIWANEISIYLCITSVFLSLGYVLKEKGHVNVDSLTNSLPRKVKLKLELVTSILAIIYSFVLAWQGWKIAFHAYEMGETSPTLLRVPMFIPRGMVFLGGGLLCIEFIREFGSILTQISNAPDENKSMRTIDIKNTIHILFVVLLIACSSLLLLKGLSLVGVVLLLFLLLFSGLPVGFSLGFLGLIGFYFLFGGIESMVQIPLIAYKNLDDFIIVSVPLFIMTASVLMVGKIGFSLFEVASTWTRHLPGGLAVSTILACAVFAAISGSAIATVVTIGSIALPVMSSKGYKREFIFGTIAIGGVLGPIIPPSLHMILIASITGDSIGKLFMAGMLPGITLAIILSIYILLKCRKDSSLPRMPKASLSERINQLKFSSFGLFTPVIILGGIYSGIFTATEAAAISTIYGLLICIFIYKTIRWKEFIKVLLHAASTSGMLLFIIVGAMTFGQLITALQIPEKIVTWLEILPFSPMIILGFTLVFILILGALMDEASILLITYPILHYVFVQNFGFDPIWFAMVFIFTLEVGLVAPPVGINLFAVQGLDKNATFSEAAKGVLPFMFLMIVTILLVVFIKPLSTWLPKTMG